MMRFVFITFLSDFGLQDDFVGTCHGVIARIAPEARVIDITHGIPPRQVLQGALVLASTLPYMPEGVHLAVVDPGVGSVRRPVALRDASGRIHVGPDNGLLVRAADAFGGIPWVTSITRVSGAIRAITPWQVPTKSSWRPKSVRKQITIPGRVYGAASAVPIASTSPSTSLVAASARTSTPAACAAPVVSGPIETAGAFSPRAP